MDIAKALGVVSDLLAAHAQTDNGREAVEAVLTLGGSVVEDIHRIANALEAIAGYGPLSDKPGSDLGALAERLAAVEDRTAGMRSEVEKLRAQADNTTETGS